jgi:radical SAM protein with 4Fe4S-binding SPASM domain
LKVRCNDAGVDLAPSNNVGYFGPYEGLIRSRGPTVMHWKGCGAGSDGIGIESDGTFKGCPSLQTDPYKAGSLKDHSAKEIWEKSATLQAHRSWSKENLWGFCRGCYYADVCKGGCTFTAHSVLGKPGNQPYCHHRALEMKAQGLREVLVKVKEAPGRPFDNGLFEIKTEPDKDDISLEARQEELLKYFKGMPRGLVQRIAAQP